MLIGFGFDMIYLQIEKTVSAVAGPEWLSVMIFEVGRAVGSQTAASSDLKRDLELGLSEMRRVMHNNWERLME